MDDVTDFPEHRIIPLGESRPYEEGRYRPPSMPAYSGIYPTHMYLFQIRIMFLFKYQKNNENLKIQLVFKVI